jgi:ABC-type multidrug transport system fused ATPase/permease subunit
MVEVSPLIGRSRRISPAAFTGRALPPAEPDPVTTGLINKNSLQLGVVSNQIQNLSNQMGSLTGSLQAIAQNLANSQALERQKEAQEQELERRLAEAKLREGKESQIERKIQAKTFAPLQKLADTAQFTLGRLGGFFTSLLGGWLLIKGVETIKALSENNSEKLYEIRDNVIKNLSLVGATFAIYKTSLAAMRGRFSRIGLLIGIVSAAGLFLKPIRQFLALIVENAGKIPGIDKIPVLKDIDFQKAADTLRGEGENKGEEEPLPNYDPTKTPAEQGLDPNLNPLKIENPDAKGGPSLAMPMEDILGKNKNEVEQNQENIQATAQPQQTMLGKPVETTDNKSNNIEGDIDPTVPAKFGEGSINVEEGQIEGQEKTSDKSIVEMSFDVNQTKSFVDTEKYISKMGTLPVGDMFSPMKKDVDLSKKVGPAPEPPINVVPIPIETSQQAPPQQQPVATGGINNAPSFATSNMDNIYTLGAYSNFNVLPV